MSTQSRSLAVVQARQTAASTTAIAASRVRIHLNVQGSQTCNRSLTLHIQSVSSSDQLKAWTAEKHKIKTMQKNPHRKFFEACNLLSPRNRTYVKALDVVMDTPWLH